MECVDWIEMSTQHDTLSGTTSTYSLIIVITCKNIPDPMDRLNCLGLLLDLLVYPFF